MVCTLEKKHHLRSQGWWSSLDWVWASFSRFLWARPDPAAVSLNMAFLTNHVLRRHPVEKLRKSQKTTWEKWNSMEIPGNFSKRKHIFFLIKKFPLLFDASDVGITLRKHRLRVQTCGGKAGFGSGDLIPSIGPAAVKSAFLPIIIFDPGRCWKTGKLSFRDLVKLRGIFCSSLEDAEWDIFSG